MTDSDLTISEPPGGPGGDLLESPEVGGKVVRGGAIRAAGFVISMLVAALAQAMLLRYLGVEDYGKYATVMAWVAIVGGITEAGLNWIGNREVSLAQGEEERRKLIANTIGLRLVITPLGSVLVAAIALATGLSLELALGIVLGGVALTIATVQMSQALALTVELRLATFTAIDTLKQTLMTIAIAVMVLAGAPLVAFFASPIPACIVVVVLTPLLVGRLSVLLPRFDWTLWRRLVRESLPVAIGIAINVLYFRVLIILVSMLTDDRETGLFGTSFRIFEVAFTVPAVVLVVILPVLSMAGAQDEERISYMLQKLTEVGLAAACGLALLTTLLAEPAVRLLGGPEYAEAVPLVQIQAWALLGTFLGQACLLGLISINRQTLMARANVVALVVVLAVGIPFISAWGSTGAAAASVVGETVLGLSLWYLLGRGRPHARPDLTSIWKPLVATAAGLTVLLIPSTTPVVEALIAVPVFLLVLSMLRGIPSEVIHAFGLGRARD